MLGNPLVFVNLDPHSQMAVRPSRLQGKSSHLRFAAVLNADRVLNLRQSPAGMIATVIFTVFLSSFC